MIFDTNIVIALLANEEPAVSIVSEWKVRGTPFFLPTVVEAEVLSFSKMTATERMGTERFLEASFISVPCDRTIARLAGRIRSAARIHLADAVIAATALTAHAPLVTRNIRDFKDVVELEVQTI
jgi:predicted nucleic acid-binding protein